MTLAESVTLLRDGGPWVFLAISGWVIRYLYTELRDLRAKHATETQALNDRIVQHVEKQIALMQTHNEHTRKIAELIARWEDRA